MKHPYGSDPIFVRGVEEESLMYTAYGKITHFDLGFLCGRSEDLFGVKITFGGLGWGCGNQIILSTGNPDQTGGENIPGWRNLEQYMRDAKAKTIAQMVGKPVEVTFDRGVLQSWRIFTEVL